MLGHALRLIRKHHDVKAKDLCNDLGISRSYLSGIENSKKEPNLDLLSRYARRFCVRRSVILKFGESLGDAGYDGVLTDKIRRRMSELFSS